MSRISAKAPRRNPVTVRPQYRSLAWVTLVVIALALAVRLAVLLQLHGHPLLQPRPGMDGEVYLQLARQVAAGDLLAGEGVFYLSPFYVYFVALVLALSGGSVLAVQVTQVALGTVAVWLIGRTAGFWFGRRGEWVAGGLAALTGYFAFNEGLILQSAVDPALTALGLWLLHRAWLSGRLRDAILAGAALGLHVLNRPNMLVWAAMAVLLTAFLALRRAPSDVRLPAVLRPSASAFLPRMASVFALAAGILLALAPVALRNYGVAGEFAPVSSHGGLNFYIGNNPQADGTYRLVRGITPSIAGQARDMRRVAEEATGRPLADGEVSSWFYGEAWAWMRREPAAAARLFGRKLLYVFNATDVPLNESYAYYATDESGVLRALAVGPWLLLPLGLAGLWLGRPRAVSGAGPSSGTPSAAGGLPVMWWAWALFIVVYALSVAAFFVAGRYRLPLLVAACVSAPGAVLSVAYRWRARALRRVAGSLALVVAMVALVNVDLGLDNGLAGWRAEMVLHHVDNREDEAARDLLARTEPGYPNRALLLFRVGQAYVRRGDAAQAVPLFERALSIAPDRPEARVGMGEALLDLGRAAEAIPHLQAAVAARAGGELTAVHLARAQAMTGNVMAARETIARLRAERLAGPVQLAVGRLALELQSPALAFPFLERAASGMAGHAGALESLALALAMQGRRAEAIRPMEEAARLDPSNAAVRLNLAILYAESGRTEEARRLATEALRLRPDYARARQFLARLGGVAS